MHPRIDDQPLAPRAHALARVFVLLADLYEHEAEPDQLTASPAEGAAESLLGIVAGQGQKLEAVGVGNDA